jgi:hypothetical protein
MTQRAAAPWRRLAVLAVAVFAVHLLLLRAAPERLAPAREAGMRFFTRQVAPPAPSPPPVAVAPATPTIVPQAPAPEPAAPPTSQAAPAPAAPVAAPPPPVASGGRAGGLALPESSAGAAFTPQVLAVPEPARMHYEVTVHTHGVALSGRAQLDWRHDGQAYEATLEISGPAGFNRRTQRSTGRITDEGLAPGYFSDKSRSEQATHFDREKGRIVFSNNRPQAAIADGMQDRLSVVVQLSMLIGGQPARFTPGTQIAIPTASTREAEDWIFSVEGEEDLDLPGGPVRALKLQRAPRRQYDQKLELWLAPRMDYAPVRLRLTNPDGGAVDQRWSATDKG